LKSYLADLEKNKVPKSGKPPVANDASDLAWKSLLNLRGLPLSNLLLASTLRSQVVDAWSGIFAWCCYFHGQRVYAETVSENAAKAIATISSLILALYVDADMKIPIKATIGVLALCTRLCMHPASPTAPFILLSILQSSTTIDNMDEIVIAADDDSKKIARILILKLQLIISQSPIPAEHTFHFVHALTNFLSIPDHPLAWTLLADTATWVVSRMLSLVAPLIGTNGSQNYSRCVHTGLTFLERALVEHNCPRSVSQAVDAGLLEAICILSTTVDRGDFAPCKPPLQHILRDILPSNLMYLSVIKMMKREHKDISPKLVDATVMKSYLCDDWMSWVLLLYTRARIAKLPKEIRGVGRVACEYANCSKTGRKSELHACGGCMYMYYCSRECQRNAWPTHRTLCKLKKSSTAREHYSLCFSLYSNLNVVVGGVPMLLDSDASFIPQLMFTDAQVHLPHLRKVTKRDFPNEPVENFMLSIDYTNVNYPAGTCSLKNINTYVFPPSENQSMDPANRNAQNQEMLNVVLRKPRCYTFIESIFMFGKERKTRNVVMGRSLWFSPRSDNVQSALDWQNDRCENHEPELGLRERFMSLTV
ncbi:MYND-type domain-containing protein, partial [Favolaschia claudopus]